YAASISLVLRLRAPPRSALFPYTTLFRSQYLHILIRVQIQFPVDAVTSYIAEIITFVGKEQSFNDSACGFLIGWFRVAQLAVDVLHRFLFRVGCIFL